MVLLSSQGLEKVEVGVRKWAWLTVSHNDVPCCRVERYGPQGV